mmetsp:Transcript_28796/g.66976  ORF Transcript_28796/g.66976 Transcript_28796/m.66976 type:complete len:2109 (+) Transcript_28796:106-6432(+)
MLWWWLRCPTVFILLALGEAQEGSDQVACLDRILDGIDNAAELTHAHQLQWCNSSACTANGNRECQLPHSIGLMTGLTDILLSQSGLAGTIPDTIGDLLSLQTLDLSDTEVSGPFPDSIRRLTLLRKIDIEKSNVNGSLDAICSLTRLEDFGAAFTDLSGTIPHCIGDLSGLQELRMGSTQLSGTLPSSIGRLSLLQKLYVDRTNVNGTWPDSFGNLTRLESFLADRTNLAGTIPNSIGTMTSLKSIELDRSQIGGSIPHAIGHLADLNKFYFHRTNLDGTIPEAVGNLTNMQRFYVSNTDVSGTLPDAFGDMTRLQHTWLGNTKLSGQLPDSIGRLSDMRRFLLGIAEWSGTLPDAIGNMSKVEWFQVYDSQLGGSIPDAIGGWTNIQRLYLHNNPNLGGTLPDALGMLSTMTHIYGGGGNKLKGTLPDAIAGLAKMEHFLISEVELTGSVPDAIGNMTNLKRLRLHTSGISGTLPGSMGACTRMNELSIHNTQLGGSLPDAVGTMTSLADVNLYNNRMTGTLPGAIGALTLLTSLWIFGNQIGGQLPSEIGQLTLLQELFAESNVFSKSLPPEIGLCTSLLSLDFRNNRLSGSLPREINELQLLEHLHLGNNQIGGPLPNNMSQMHNLVLFDMIDNSLSGEIVDGSLPLRSLQELHISGNPQLGGVLPSLQNASQLTDLDAHGCSFTDISALPPSLLHIDLRSNRLKKFPDSMHDVPSMQTMHLSDNEISTWPHAGVTPIELVSLDGEYSCHMSDVWAGGSESWNRELSNIPPFKWPNVYSVDVSNNPLGEEVFIFVQTLFYASGIVSLNARNCQLRGNLLPFAFHELIGDHCQGRSPLVQALPALQNMDLSDNHIKAVYAPFPPVGLFEAKLENNSGLHYIGREWLNERGNHRIERLHLRNNPELTLPVMPPDTCGIKKAGPVSADPDSYIRATENAAYECTTPCTPAGLWELLIDAGQSDPGALCRCSPGHGLLPGQCWDEHWRHWNQSASGGDLMKSCNDIVNDDHNTCDVEDEAQSACCGCNAGVDDFRGGGGNGMNCVACPKDMYAFSEPLDVHKWRSVCVACPAGAMTLEDAQSSVCSCQCPVNSYLSAGHACADNGEEDGTPHRFTGTEVCVECPASATTIGIGHFSRCDCLCPVGSYLSTGAACNRAEWPADTSQDHDDENSTECKRCSILRTTTQEGAMGPLSCVCNVQTEESSKDDGSIPGLVESYGQCGCPEGSFFDSIALACRPCREQGEYCKWEYDLARSLRPPKLQRGYWASTASLIDQQLVDDSHFETGREVVRFEGHSLYRCFNEDTCIDENGTCAPGRIGIACGLCAPSHFGGPDGPCHECQGSALVPMIAVAAVVPCVVIFFHILSSQGDSKKRGVLMTLRSFRVSGRQLVKHMQIVQVVQGFSIGWPIDVERAFKACQAFSFRLSDVTATACMVEEQSAGLELAFSWSLPFAFAIIGICTAPCLSVPLSALLKRCRWKYAQWVGSHVRMTLRDAIKAVYWCLLLVFPTLFNFGLSMFACRHNPNHEYTVLTHPHLHCPGSASGVDEEWSWLFPICIFYNVSILLIVVGFYIVAWRQTLSSLENSSYESRGRHAFLFEDFRHTALHWPLNLLLRDMVVNMVQSLLINYGTAQLLCTGIFSLLLGYFAVQQHPYADLSNNLLEIANAFSIFTLCIFTAGMGYAEEPSISSVAAMVKGSSAGDAMAMRASVLLGFQLISILGPFLIIGYQLLILVPCIERRLPPAWRPLLEDEEEQVREVVVRELVEDEDVVATKFKQVVDRMDSFEVRHFSSFMQRIPATVGLLREPGKKATVKGLINRGKTYTLEEGGSPLQPSDTNQWDASKPVRERSRSKSSHGGYTFGQRWHRQHKELVAAVEGRKRLGDSEALHKMKDQLQRLLARIDHAPGEVHSDEGSMSMISGTVGDESELHSNVPPDSREATKAIGGLSDGEGHDGHSASTFDMPAVPKVPLPGGEPNSDMGSTEGDHAGSIRKLGADINQTTSSPSGSGKDASSAMEPSPEPPMEAASSLLASLPAQTFDPNADDEKKEPSGSSGLLLCSCAGGPSGYAGNTTANLVEERPAEPSPTVHWWQDHGDMTEEVVPFKGLSL